MSVSVRWHKQRQRTQPTANDPAPFWFKRFVTHFSTDLVTFAMHGKLLANTIPLGCPVKLICNFVALYHQHKLTESGIHVGPGRSFRFVVAGTR
jgi:hypothetical protein